MKEKIEVINRDSLRLDWLVVNLQEIDINLKDKAEFRVVLPANKETLRQAIDEAMKERPL